MRAIITVIGKDSVGILGKVSTACAQAGANIIEVTQSVLLDTFAMIMMVDVENSTVRFSEFQQQLNDLGDKMGMKIHVMHEDIFNSMHKI